MDPNQTQDDQIVQNPKNQPQVNGQVSVNPGGKEEAPVSLNSEQNPLDEFATHKPPEVSPEVERAGVKHTMPTASVQKTLSGTLSNVMPRDPSHITKKDVKRAHRFEETGNTSFSITWLAALLEFIEKKILRKEAGQSTS